MMKYEDYTIGWVCALPLEVAAAYGMLDEQHDPLPSRPNDSNNYKFGRIGQHNVVIACLPYGVMGKISAARVAERLLLTFSALRFALMVGIGGGVPSDKHDIRLGDVVISRPAGTSGGVIQYDYGKTVQDGRFARTGSLNRPPDVLLNAVAVLEAENLMKGHKISHHLSEMIKKFPKMATQFTSPGPECDTLHKVEYDHPREHATCVNCDRSKRVHRQPRPTEDAVVHYGLVASGDQVMKHGATRDTLRRELDVLCFEMEASGLMDAFPCLVIRGICDYSDSHKNDRWQPFAAATAAAYAKELLNIISPTDVTAANLAKQTTESNCGLIDRNPKIAPGSLSHENTPPASGFAPQDTNRVQVAAKYCLASVPYTLNDVKLGCLVLQKKQPNQNSTGPLRTLREGIDYTWRSQRNFQFFQHVPEPVTILSLLKQLFSTSNARDTEPDKDLWSTEGRIYELAQPRELFRHLCRTKEVREWLMDAYDDGYSPHFIVGYRTLFNATLANNARPVEGLTGNLAEQRKDHTFQVPGERIFAIAFQQVRYSWSDSDGRNLTTLAKDTVWSVTPLRRGFNATNTIVEVYLDDDVGASNHMLVMNQSNREEYYIPNDEVIDNEIDYE